MAEKEQISPDTGKGMLRRQYRKTREELTKEQVADWSSAVQGHLRNWEQFHRAEAVCFYYPLGKEVNLLNLAKEALDMGKRIYFPKTAGARIEFYRVTNLKDFTEGSFHVMEPRGGQPLMEAERTKECVQTENGENADGVRPGRLLVLVPGVAFDRSRQRIGYGKGYYDKYLAGLSGAVKTGIAYGCQIAEAVLAEETDISMDYMATETGIW